MSVIGIVAEYNPFHRGHQYHIRRTKELAGEDSTVVCVMSGDFVQRGEAAIYSKFARAEAACRCGADLVVELPLPWCLASAESFARGAVSLLDALGCEAISFGSEAGKLDGLDRLAYCLLQPETNERVSRILTQEPNLSYAAARQRAVFECCGETARLMETPNNILAIEYLKAIRALRSDMQPMTVRRIGSAHDGNGGEFRSAAEIRALLQHGESIEGELPAEAAEVFSRTDQTDAELLETAILSRLRALPAEAFELLQDGSDGLGRRLYQSLEEPTLEAVMAAVKSKRYALARIRRLICCAALGVRAGMTASAPPYARLLAANASGCKQLRKLRGSEIPVITKPAAVRELGGRALEIFAFGASAHDLYVLGLPNAEARRGGADWRTSPIIL